uniref:Uncharacterized protein n=1 Tax=Globisporangium ultimum (strain ATCC 200006 / CBS 805.95 / DAOM BR144) TaxID=431595 RepID=K3WBB7_GLOUD
MDKLVKRLQDQEQHPVSEALVKQFATAQPPATLDNVNLHDYQLHGMRWMLTKYVQDLNPILGDEMGLGKTLQVIAFIASLLEYFESEDAPRKKNPDEAAMFLIVAPLSVLPNWMEQFERFAPSIDVVVYTGQKIERQVTEEKVKARKAKPLVVVTSYEMVLFNTDFFGGTTWKLLILDEGHRLKNAKGKLYEVLSTKLPVKHKVILSGTPIQNNLTELFSLLSFLNPTIFSNQQLFETTFKDYFSAKAQQLDPKKAATKSMHLLAAEDLMRDILTPLLLLRTIHDVNSSFTLPPISEMVVHTPLSPMQREFYKEIVAKNSELINAVAANHASRVNLTNILPQLRKICNHPYLFPGTEPEPFCEGPHLYQNSGKLYVLQQILPCLKADGHCVLLFSQSTAFLDILQDFLTMEGFSYERIDGSVRGKERWQAIERFRHAPETFVFLISTRSGGVGLNLQRADTVIFADSDYNPQQDLQAVARAYRLGQTKPIHVIKFLCASTVEEIIYRRALKKMRMADKIRNCARQVDDEEDDLDNEASLVEMIQFGLHKLMEEPEGEELALTKPLDDEYITHILARRTVDANVVVLEDGTVKNEKVTEAGGDFQEENMYYFEGEDHSAPDAKAKARDGEALKQLLSATKISKRRRPNSLHERYVGEENDNYEEKEELDEATIAENEAEKARKREERRQKRLDKKLAMWKAHGYESTAIPVDDGGDDGSSPGVNFAATNQIRYKAGDASQPSLASIRSDAVVIVHCVDTSGVWSSRGFFRSLSALSPTIQRQYEAAAKNDDLKLGQAHLIQLPSRSEGGRNVGMFVCLLVVQGYVDTSGQGKKKKLRGGAPLVHYGKSTTFRMHALETSLHALARRAHALHASVHMPRIGYGTPHFNWYAVERIIQRQLRDAGVS